MAVLRISNSLFDITKDEIEALIKSIIYPNDYDYLFTYTKIYSFEDKLIEISCELSKWGLLENGLYNTYFVINYKKSLKNSIDYISNLIDLLNEHQIKVHLECEEQDDNGNVTIDEFIIRSKDDLLKLR